MTGTTPLSIKSRSTVPGPTDGSWSTSPTRIRLAWFGTARTREYISGTSTIEVSSTTKSSHESGFDSFRVNLRFDERLVKYDFGELDEVALAYAVTIHKSQGSEFPAVVIPLATQHYMLLQRNLIYTGITRGKRLLVLVGQKKALGIAVRNDRSQRRYSGLLASLRGNRRAAALA